MNSILGKNNRIGKLLGAMAFISLVSACSVSPRHPAPVVNRMPSTGVPKPAPMPAGAQGSEVFYTVKPGDTLIGIALEFGHDWREIAKANNITDPDKIMVGQRLKVQGFDQDIKNMDVAVPEGSAVEITPVVPAGGVKPATPPASPSAVTPPASATAPETPLQPPKPFAATPGFVLPHGGEIIQSFKPGINKGIDFAAKVGDPVKAAQAGRVVYAGSALRGYGNLIILKHDNNLLTAYAHNKTLLVKEGEPVTKGQKIAEAGQSDAERPKLHFEVRKQGKPVDPMDYLPKR